MLRFPVAEVAIGPDGSLAPMAQTPPAELIWVPAADEYTDEAMSADGLIRVRSLFQMRCALPLDQPIIESTREVELRSFDPTTDVDGFLAVNNRAFDWHPEQGGWTREILEARIAEPWFDPGGFLIHESEDSTIDGFCWTKVHPATDDNPSMGEIYVIAADPSAHGTGLGRALTVGGLVHLAGVGLRVGMLYVEHDNEPAVSLYRRLGFSVHHVDAAYSAMPTPEP